MTKILVGCGALALALSAWADQPAAPAAAAPDMSKVGPASRKVTKEDKKGVDALYKAMEEAHQKNDCNAMADLIDFPIIMITDDSKGMESHSDWNRETWIKVMEPMVKNMPKDMKFSQKRTVHFLSDDLAFVDEDETMTKDKTKTSWHGEAMLVRKDGKWKLKMEAEAGWGDMKSPQAPTAAAPAAGSPPAGK